MAEIGAMLWDMKGYFVTGAIVLGVGLAMFLVARSMGPDIAKSARWVAFPVIGCGGCLFLYPLFSISGAILLFFGVVAVCEGTGSC